jgi:two-component system, NarL family, sensor kinase
VSVAAVGGYFALRTVALDEARRETRGRLVAAAALVEASLTDGVLRTDPESISIIDDLVLSRVLTETTVRVKIWSAAGEIVYSDQPTLIGRRFNLGEDEIRLFREGGENVEVSDLTRPENVFDRDGGELLEAYTRVRTPSGTPLLFETYERFDSISASAGRLLGALAPPIFGALGLIALAQVPLVWSLTRRLQQGHEEREGLLVSAVDASSRERSRIASYLHDGAVQDVAGVAFALTPLVDEAAARGDAAAAAELGAAVKRLRGNVRDLRALLVDLHPPNLAAAGVASAIADLVSPLQARGVAVDVQIDGAESLTRDEESLVYRVAQEAVRNVISHARPASLGVTLRADPSAVRLAVVDDGRGFDDAARVISGEKGHLGLSLLERLVDQAGGTLVVQSAVGQGVRVELEIPRR